MPLRQILAFGAFELDPQSGDLRKHGLAVRLADQPFQILLLLVDRPGEVVTRDEIRQRLWRDDTFVDFDAGLSSAVRKLRDALGDSAENPRFVQTLPRRGYRFIAPVTVSGNGVPAPRVDPAAPASAGGRRITRSAIFAAAAFFIVIATTGWYWAASRPRTRTGAPPARIESVAVLPFENLTGDPGQEYLADAVTEELTTDLAQIDGLQVISRTSTRQYKGTTKRLSAVGADLGVDTIVEGSIERIGDRLRVSTQVIQAAADRHLWARTFEGDLGDIRRLQDDIGRAISAAVSPEGPPVLQIRVGRRAVNNEAYAAYLKGVANVGRGSQAAFRDAVVYFDEAIARQPDFAMAYAAKAQAQLQPVYAGPFAPRDIVPQAEATVRRALELDDSLPQAHRVLGSILQEYYYRWEEGDREYQRARQLQKRDDDAHIAAANAFARKGRFDEAVAEADRVRKLDPLSQAAALSIAGVFREARQYERALAEYRRALEINPNVARAHFQIGITYARMSRVADAIPELEEALRLTPDNTRFRAYLAWLYAKADRAGDARKILSDLQALARRQYVSSFGMALIHDALNDSHETIAALERAYEEHAVELAQLKQYPPFESVRSNPQYEALIQRVARHE